MKKVLFDENVPRLLRRDLIEFEIRTVQEEGWSSLSNGVPLRQAQERFEVFVTADKRLEYQRNARTLKIAVVVVAAESTRLEHMRRLLPRPKTAIAVARLGTVVVVSAA